MKKIVYLPLDERPCNYAFPSMLLQGNTDFTLVVPPIALMGNKKRGADADGITNFLIENTRNAYALVLSVDTLLYGGIVPSRLHGMEEATLAVRLSLIEELKRANPALKIYAFSLIMRCPQYSSADEEPDYYGACGREIFLLGEAFNKRALGCITEAEEEKVAELTEITKNCISDYLARRERNTAMNLACIDLVGEYIDHLIIPQDDSAVYGYTAMDQQKVRRYTKECGKQLSVYMYPGADEVGMVLIARAVNEAAGCRPRIAAEYSSTQGATVIPLYEDRIVAETIKYQILAAGGIPVTTASEADIVLAVNAPSANMTDANMCNQDRGEYAIERNVVEMAERIGWYSESGKAVAVADIAYGNGGDLEFVKLLASLGALFRVAAYAGWNTSGNTLGTAVSQACLYRLYGETRAHRNFLALRYFEDIGYCSHTRKYICDHVLPGLGLNYFNSGDVRGRVAAEVKNEINRFLIRELPDVTERFEIADCRLPWRRMFEVGLTVQERKERRS